MVLKGITILAFLAALVGCLLTANPWVMLLAFGLTWLGLAVAFFLVLWVSCAIVDLKKPQEEDSPYYRGLMYLAIEAAMTIIGVKLELTGLEKTPRDGRFVLMCNHIYDLDPLVLHLAFRNSQLAFITKQENCSMFLVGKLMHKTLCQPINRENDREALKTIIKCIQILKEDKASIAVFPEGYTSLDRKLHPFRSGVFKIAQKANVPIAVCTVQNTYQVLDNVLHLRPTTVKIHLLEVIGPEEFAKVHTNEIADRVHKLMADDLGPDLVLQDEAE